MPYHVLNWKKLVVVTIQILLTLFLMRGRNLQADVIVMLPFCPRRPSVLDRSGFTISGSWPLLIYLFQLNSRFSFNVATAYLWTLNVSSSYKKVSYVYQSDFPQVLHFHYLGVNGITGRFVQISLIAFIPRNISGTSWTCARPSRSTTDILTDVVSFQLKCQEGWNWHFCDWQLVSSMLSF